MKIGEEIYCKDRYGKRRMHTVLKCEQCGEIFIRENNLIENGRKFCSVKCRGLSIRNRLQLVCAYCGKHFERSESKAAHAKHGVSFCCRECKDKGQRISSGISAIHPNHYAGGEYVDYRQLAFDTYGAKCAVCGIANEIMLDVHHIDGDRSNNGIENLIVLCANHHVSVTRKAAKIEGREYIILGV